MCTGCSLRWRHYFHGFTAPAKISQRMSEPEQKSLGTYAGISVARVGAIASFASLSVSQQNKLKNLVFHSTVWDV